MINFAWSYESFLAFWLCFARSMAFIINLPLFEEVSIPVVVKILFTVFFTFLSFALVEPIILKDISSIGVSNFWWLTIFYTIAGFTLSFLLKLIAEIILSASHLMTQQMGFSQMTMFDPTIQASVSPIERITRWVIIGIILMSGALTPFFKGLVLSYEKFSLIQLIQWKDLGYFFMKLYWDLFIISLLLASPIVFCGVGFNLLLGLLARMVPQINLLMMSFMITIVLGLVVYFFIFEDWVLTSVEHYTNYLGLWFQWLR